jgi:hypothetical protein
MNTKLKEILKKFFDAGIEGDLPLITPHYGNGAILSEEKLADLLELLYESCMKAKLATDKKKEDE